MPTKDEIDDMYQKRDPIKKILSLITKQSNGCWFYNGYKNKNGYGCISIGSKNQRKYLLCHRLIYEHFKGDIEGLFVCHTCDNPSCCNPDHLFLGTAKDNNLDKTIKGRSSITWGEKSGQHKLKTIDVLKIRNDFRPGVLIAKEYGVTKSNVSMIKNYKSRKYE